MTKREIVGRYKGSVIGLLWSFLTPVFMLIVYTFVFSVAFKARWGGSDDESKIEFAVVLFAGLIVYNLFAEVVIRAPVLIINNINYVKKIVFPLEILPVISMGAALFHSLVSILVLIVAFFFLNNHLWWTSIFLPLILFPFVMFTLGAAWILASLGVFLRDVGQVVGIAMTAVLFCSPVFYSISALPEMYRPLIMLNPLTFIIEQVRGVIIYGRLPDWNGLTIYAALSIFISWIGYVWFQKTRKGFSNVL
jgi:lipopolysaccharide transport system permease protein